jgi:transposase
MSARELTRVEVLARVKAGTLTVKSAAVLLHVGYRQAKRLVRRYRALGAKGLRHGGVGRRSNRARTDAERSRVVALIREKYSGAVGVRFGPTLATEHLASEDGEWVSVDTVRRWMLAAGLWSRARQGTPHRQRRDRKAHFGELVQLDGSFHLWYEDRAPPGCLMTLVDDATSRTWGRLGDQETIWAAVAVLRGWIERHGVPLALYTDWKNVYVRAPTPGEQAAGVVPVTQFGRMCAALDIRIIAAHSPQAKGRVERNHGTQQDRLVKKLRRRTISEAATANVFLETTHWADHNARFAQAPASPEDFHRRAPSRTALDAVFQIETMRVVSNDWVVQYHARHFQLGRQSAHAPARSTVLVRENAVGTIEIRYRDRRLAWTEIAPARPKAALPPRAPVPKARAAFRPSVDHPWRRDTRPAERELALCRAANR